MAHIELPDQPAGPLLELHGQRKRFTVPFGLKTLLEEMTREVIRVNPTNIYGFLADYLDDRLVAREAEDQRTGKGKHSWEWRRWSWDGSSLLSNDELIAFLAEYKISVEIAQHLAIIIQAAYKGFMARKEFHHVQEEHQHRKESLWDDWRHEGNLFVSGKDVQDILSYYGISLFEANAIATKIQKVFRGYFTRRSLALADPELAAHLQELGISHHEANRHATTIQSLFRGYKARKAKEAAAAGLLQDEEEEEAAEEEEDEEKYKAELAAAMQEEEFLKELEEAKLRRTSAESGGSEMARTTSLDRDDSSMEIAAAKIQAGFRGMKARKEVKAMREKMAGVSDNEEEEEEFEHDHHEEADETENEEEETKVKYDAYFPGGYDDASRVVGTDGIEIPPKFTHEHFGEIDPLEVRQKFSEVPFREKMSYMMKDLNDARTLRLKERRQSRKALEESTKAPPPAPENSAPVPKAAEVKKSVGESAAKPNQEPDGEAAAGGHKPSMLLSKLRSMQQIPPDPAN